MNVKSIALAIIAVVWLHPLLAQTFQYKRELPAIRESGWVSITIPPEMFEHLRTDYTDLRLYKLTEQDSVETPYLVNILEDVIQEGSVQLRVLNQSMRNGVLFITCELPKGVYVNYLNLSFHEPNYDAYVSLEGSADQKKWYDIIANQRIVAVKNQDVEFRSNTIHFPETNYRFIRASVRSSSSIRFHQASFHKRELKPGKSRDIAASWKVAHDKKNKQTVISINLPEFQPVNEIDASITHDSDYYRSCSLEVLADSAKSEKGWIYYYQPVHQTYLTSLQNDQLKFTATAGKTFRMTIRNADNPPITVQDLRVRGPIVQLLARVAAGATYVLCYGAEALRAPQYDLIHFKNQLPAEAVSLALGPEQTIGKQKPAVAAFIQNKAWLWVAMALVIAILGFFTIRMMKNQG